MSGKEAIELDLTGDESYETVLCTDEYEIEIGESIAVLQFRTVNDAVLRVPIAIASLKELAELMVAAAESASEDDERGTIQ